MDQPVESVKGVGTVLASALHQRGIHTVGEMLLRIPRDYVDFGDTQPIAHIVPGKVTIRGALSRITSHYVRRGMHLTEAQLQDDTGAVKLVWFNQPYRANTLKSGAMYQAQGEFALRAGRLSIQNPTMYEHDAMQHTSIVPIYQDSKDIAASRFRRIITSALQVELSETLPVWVCKQWQLESLQTAFRLIHQPKTIQDVARGMHRLAFEELFQLILAAQLSKQQLRQQLAPAIPFRPGVFQSYIEALPYELTAAQRRVAWQIVRDMEKTVPMNRLVEGDVGSGKTLVALLAALSVLASGSQVAMLAPTEVLARQHAEKLYQLLEATPYQPLVGLLVGSMKPKEKLKAKAAIADGTTGLIVGTQALLQESVDLSRVALVIVDEQHRFGVEQRRLLQVRAHHAPHVLTMTATPIPRTLALTVFGELDISILDELPPGRTPVWTKLWSPNSRPQLYKKIDEQIAAGHQVFVVCPLIEQSAAVDALSASAVYDEIRQKLLPHRRIALLHGKLKSIEKEQIMSAFVQGEYDVLVSTTVIEVGVDVPNATVMVIEGADRFGLAQMHQLRGRVGRGSAPGFCFVIPSTSKQPSKRLRAIEQSTDGFALAELDLEIRGPGALYGVRQSGELDLRMARFDDAKLIAAAREAVAAFLLRDDDLLQYPVLNNRISHFQKVMTLN